MTSTTRTPAQLEMELNKANAILREVEMILLGWVTVPKHDHPTAAAALLSRKKVLEASLAYQSSDPDETDDDDDDNDDILREMRAELELPEPNVAYLKEILGVDY